MSNAIVEARNVVKRYSMGEQTLEVLKGISLAIHSGEGLAILGPSGAGKSTLLHILGLLDTPSDGEVLFKGEATSGFSEKERARLRNEAFGFVFQFHHLLPDFNALENVLAPSIVGCGVRQWLRSRRRQKKRAAELLDRLGLGERIKHMPNQLSGGERQRVAIARAMMNNPEVLLCDEPTGNLDRRTGQELIDLLVELNRDGQTIVVVTHDARVAEKCSRRIVIEDGQIIERQAP